MNQEQLIEQYLRLKRKLSMSYQSHSGRVDRLVDALQAVEREIRARHLDLASARLEQPTRY